jgi:putative effector of murein hydrolase LrgA (UPF0299 family)
MSTNFWIELAVQVAASLIVGALVAGFVVTHVKARLRQHEEEFHGRGRDSAE